MMLSDAVTREAHVQRGKFILETRQYATLSVASRCNVLRSEIEIQFFSVNVKPRSLSIEVSVSGDLSRLEYNLRKGHGEEHILKHSMTI